MGDTPSFPFFPSIPLFWDYVQCDSFFFSVETHSLPFGITRRLLSFLPPFPHTTFKHPHRGGKGLLIIVFVNTQKRSVVLERQTSSHSGGLLSVLHPPFLLLVWKDF